MNGRGLLFQWSIHARMSASSAMTLWWLARRSICVVRKANHRSTWFSQEE